MRTRVRFGIRLGWPLKNAAVFVFYTSKDQYERIKEVSEWLRTALVVAGQDDLASRLVCEGSEVGNK